MPAGVKFHAFVQDVARGVHNLHTGSLKVMLTNTAPSQANSVKADITEIAAGGGYTAGGTALTGVTATQTTGLLTLTGADVTFLAAGGSMAAWRYAVLYNDTPTSPVDPLIAYWDRGSSVTLAVGESEVVDFTTNPLTLT